MKNTLKIFVVLSALLFVISCSSAGITYDDPQDIIKDTQSTTHGHDHDF